MAVGTIKASDLGNGYPSAVRNDPTSLQAASPRLPTGGGATPMQIWVILVVGIVIMRVIYEVAPPSARIG